MSELRTDIRVKAEGLGVTTKTVTTFLILHYASRRRPAGNLALLAFALGQLSYSVCLLAKYINAYGIKLLVPQFPSIKSVPFSLFGPFNFDDFQGEPRSIFRSTTVTSLFEHDYTIRCEALPYRGGQAYSVLVQSFARSRWLRNRSQLWLVHLWCSMLILRRTKNRFFDCKNRISTYRGDAARLLLSGLIIRQGTETGGPQDSFSYARLFNIHTNIFLCTAHRFCSPLLATSSPHRASVSVP